MAEVESAMLGLLDASRTVEIPRFFKTRIEPCISKTNHNAARTRVREHFATHAHVEGRGNHIQQRSCLGCFLKSKIL